MAKRVGRHPAAIVVAALLGTVTMATIMGCAASALAPGDYGGGEAAMRLSGGSCPGGEKVCGYVLAPFGGVGARDVGDEFWELAHALVTLQDPTGAQLTDRTDDGAFGFADPHDGKSVLTFDLNGDGRATSVEIDVKVRGRERTEVLAGVLPLSGGGRSRHSKIRIKSSTDRLLLSDPTAQAVVSATVDDLPYASPDLVWVMETKADAHMMPFAVGDGVYTTDKVVIVPGSTKGKVEVWAQLPDRESNKVKIVIRDR